MDNFTVKELAHALSAKAVGNLDIAITGAAEPQDAQGSLLAIATSKSFVARLGEGKAKVALLTTGTDWHNLNLEAAIFVSRPRYALAGLSLKLDKNWRQGEAFIHPHAAIDSTAKIAPGARIGAFCYIGAGVVLGKNAWLGTHVTLANGSFIGAECTLLDGVKIGRNVTIGKRFVAQPGAVIGADGFSYVSKEVAALENVRVTLGDRGDALPQPYHKIHSLGAVEIGDDVEIGANSCVDRGTVRDTIIGSGCKVDNLAQIGHNVKIGTDCLICAQVGIAGSSTLGDNVVLGGQTGISDNLFVGNNVITGGATKVLTNVPSGRVMLGYPAMKMKTQLDIYKSLRRLPSLVRDLAKLKADNQKD
jgi:UDP-3-O-[3-hydroxymyristoyl] glucosamine N-acyltransferase